MKTLKTIFNKFFLLCICMITTVSAFAESADDAYIIRIPRHFMTSSKVLPTTLSIIASALMIYALFRFWWDNRPAHEEMDNAHAGE